MQFQHTPATLHKVQTVKRPFASFDPSCHTHHHISHLLKQHIAECLREDIGFLFRSRDPFDHDSLLAHMVANEVMLDVDMFRARVMTIVGCNRNGRLVVASEHGSAYLLETHLLQQCTEP